MAATDKPVSAGANATAPADFYEAVTPSDTVELTHISRAIYVGTGGNLVAVRTTGAEVSFTAVPDGTMLPIRVKRIKATGTTATNIVSLA
jgi:hypothetical protein